LREQHLRPGNGITLRADKGFAQDGIGPGINHDAVAPVLVKINPGSAGGDLAVQGAKLDAIARGLACARTRWQRAALQKTLQQRWQSVNAGERAVMHRVVQGQLNKQIAWELGVSEITVKVRRAQAMRKMQAQSLPELVRLMEKLGVGNQESMEIITNYRKNS